MDLIDRQAAIDALHMHLMYRMGTDSNKKRLDDWINNLPSVQPEIIRCKDCKYFCTEQVEEQTPYGFTNMHLACWCDKHTDYENQKYLEVNTDDFCSWAERKEE